MAQLGLLDPGCLLPWVCLFAVFPQGAVMPEGPRAVGTGKGQLSVVQSPVECVVVAKAEATPTDLTYVVPCTRVPYHVLA